MGAALRLANGRVLSAWNRPVRETWSDDPALLRRPEKYGLMVHAEAAVLSVALRLGLSCQGAEIAVTHMPCDACARLLVEAGVSRLVLHAEPPDMG